ncbi:hypothetical protein F5884DRAFT_674767 [Xylogone sp. PMI_703]|nr:hypothetical protein F5884DRAFT_674767 [Xylogone sp. PMI_703]
MAIKKCNICDRRFSKTEHLKRHERAHTKERPYKCITCNKSFSRSDVLYRHSKGHAAKKHPTEIILNGLKSSSGCTSNDSTPTTPITVSLESKCGTSENTQSNEGRQLEPARTHWNSPPSEDATTGTEQLIACDQDQLMVVPNTLDGDQLLATSAPCLIPETWTSNFPQILNPFSDFIPSIGSTEALKDIPSDILQMWLFSDNSLLQSTSQEIITNDSGLTTAIPAFVGQEHSLASPSGTSSSTSTRISQCQLSRVEKSWKSLPYSSTRSRKISWKDVISSRAENLYCDVPPINGSSSHRPRQHCQWGFDEECLDCLKDALDSISPLNCQIKQPRTVNRRTPSTPESINYRYQLDHITFPPVEIFELALEMYFFHFNPTLPLIHGPTFSAKNAPSSLLLAMCLLGLSILGTAGARNFVSKIFPIALNLASFDLQAITRCDCPHTQQLSILVTALLMIHVASISGSSEKISQAETLYMNLISASQHCGLFSCDETPSPYDLLEEITDIDQKWKTWARIESINYLAIGLLEIDCWFATYLSISPLIRPDTVRIMPPSTNSLFRATSAAQWGRLMMNGKRVAQTTVTPRFSSISLTKLEPGSIHSLLTLYRLRILEAQYHLITLAGDSEPLLEPWRVYSQDLRTHKLATLIVELASPNANVFNSDINSIVAWHTLCMMLGANFKIFESAAGRNGADLAQGALEEVSTWSKTAAARRSCIHAAHIFMLLLNRRISDTVTMHSVHSLFQSALILSFYTLMMSGDQQDDEEDCLELYDEVDWTRVSCAGLEDSSFPADAMGSDEVSALSFIRRGGPISIAGWKIDGGYEAARRCMVHCADLMDGIGRWKSRSFSQILHIMGDDLSDFDIPADN